MNFINVEVRDSTYHFQSKLDSRLTIVFGDSGVGKTTLVDEIQESYTSDTVELTCDKNTVVIDGVSLDTMKQNITSMTNTLFIFDDSIFSSMKQFYSAFYQSSKDNWFLIFARDGEQINNESLNLNNLHYGVNSYKIFMINGIEHWLEDYFVDCVEDNIFVERDYTEVTVHTEDSSSGKVFMTRLFDICNVREFNTVNDNGLKTTGKDIIVNNINNIINDSSSESLHLLLIDMSAFGPYIFKLLGLLCVSNVENKFIFFYKYECFEYLLLKSNLVSADGLHELWDKEQFETFEKFCESKLDELSKDKRYEQRHNRPLKDCWTEHCGEMRMCKNCTDGKDYQTNGQFSKLEWLLYKTKFQFLLIVKQLIADKFIWTD